MAKPGKKAAGKADKRAAKPVAAKGRAYEGASPRDGWRPRRAGASANTDHRADAGSLRARARSLVQNVPYIARGLQALVSATVGTGISPRSMAPRKRDAKRLDELWSLWGSRADADGLFDVYGLEAAAYRAMEQDGEVLIRRRQRRPEDGLAVPLQLQLLEVDWLDSAKQASLAGGARIVNGIQYDGIGRISGYWLFDGHPGDQFSTPARTASRFVPASEIIHLFAPSRPGQGRGITRLAPVIARARDLMLYEDAELQRKNLETRLGIVATGDPASMANPRDYSMGPGNGGETPTAASPAHARQDGDLGQLPSGGITELPPGLQLTQIDPKAAPGMVDYCKWQLHMIAAGIGVPYESMTGDMREVNFSSARVRLIDFRRDCEQMQWLVLIPKMMQRIWQWFVDAVALAGELPRPEYAVDWSTPRWDYVNPEQDVKAELAAIGGGLLTVSEALRRRGYKPDDVFSELGSDFDKLKRSGALEMMSYLATKANPPAP
jgi:lambda family phage portal protein